jgi:hypothetical protein
MAAPSRIKGMRELIGDGWIGPVQCAGREILRRIFVTARDRNWQEVRPANFERTIDETRRTARLLARHTSDLVDFEWQGEFTVSPDGQSLRFEFEGRALRDIEICRLGLVVLHPVEAMVGSTVTASHEQATETIVIDRQLAPQPIIQGLPGAMTEPFCVLRIQREDFGTLALTFGGERFELEDQRNWGDASFKSYCTPLRLGFPRAIEANTVIRHSVQACYTPPASAPRTAASDPVPASDAKSLRLPVFGRVWRADTPLEAAAWDYLSVDLSGRDYRALASLLQASRTQQLEIGLDADVGPASLASWIDVIGEHRARIVRILLYGQAVSLPSVAALERWRRAMGDALTPRLPIFAATHGYFVEFNRAVPFTPPVDGIVFPLTATVHSDDPETVMSNVGTVRDMAETARRLTKTAAVALVPLALYHPPAAKPVQVPEAFVLKWLTATLRHATEAGVTSITLADDLATALRGILGMSPSKTLSQLIEAGNE